jgi:hypothetical protein
VLDPGDVVFFDDTTCAGSTRTAARRARAVLSSSTTATRASVPWDDEPLEDGRMGNDRHIFARGSTDLPYARPRWA